MSALVDIFFVIGVGFAFYIVDSRLDDLEEHFKVRMIDHEVCTQHTDYKHCVDGTQITFNGGIK